MNRISSLPDDIIGHIVSFLSAKEAAFAVVLSKRWQNLLSIIQNVEFDATVENQRSLTDFLDGVLALPLSSRIWNFSLKCRKGVDPTHYAHVNRCLFNVLKRGVFDLTLDIKVEEGYSLPFEVFTCKTLVKLDLGTCFTIDFLPQNAYLPALKTLVIDSIKCHSVFQKLYPACPQLVGIELGRVGAAILLQSRLTELYRRLKEP